MEDRVNKVMKDNIELEHTGSGGEATLIFSRSVRWRWVVSFTFRLLVPWYPLKRRLDSRVRPDVAPKIKSFLYAGSRTSIEISRILNSRKTHGLATLCLNCLRNQRLLVWRGSVQPFKYLFGLPFQRISKIGLGVRLEEATLFPKEVSEVVQDKSLVYSGGVFFFSVAFLYLMVDTLLSCVSGDRTGPVEFHYYLYIIAHFHVGTAILIKRY